jgi:PST family polysaccharide transporter
MGGAQVINLAASLVKMKAAAVLLGPAGVGLIGLYLIVMNTASSVVGMGLNNVGIRQVAAAHIEGGSVAVGRTRRALFWGTMLLALIGSGLFWLTSGWIARVIFGDESRTNDVAWLSLGIALTVATGSQGALLIGLRRTGDQARIMVGAGVIGASLGIVALWIWGAQAMIAMVLIAPIITFLLGHLYVARLGPPGGPMFSLPEMAREWKTMLTLGFAFMLSELVTTLGHLVTRTVVLRELGPDALGQFVAAWTIGMTYLGLILSAMQIDYYPRLIAAINDPVTASRLVNEQTEVALLLCAPVLLALLGFAPWVMHLLYSAEFGPAVEILRWQILANILKVMCWPLGFVLLAAGTGKTYTTIQSLGTGVFVLGVMVGVPIIGVTATGVAFLALYAAHLPLVWWLGGRQIGFRWTRAITVQALVTMLAAVIIFISTRWSEPLGAVLGLGLSLATGSWAVMRLSAMAEQGGRLGRIAGFGERVRGWLIRR